MLRPRQMQLVFSLAAVGQLVGWAANVEAAEPAVDFLRDVKPILAQRCYRCHSSLKEESSYRLDSVQALVKGGDFGPAVVPGKSGESRLIEAVLGTGDLKMPPEGAPLTEAQIATLRAWIDAGAKPPEGDSAQKIEHWSYQKPVRPALPTAADPAWNANPIDALVAAKHAELGLTPVGEAPPNLLLRRVYLDLVGLPPTPDELAAFLADSSPAAYEKVVDKLLDSPQYGERWGRHWMDVWRYSDWDGYGNEVRESKPHIWRWRDWIVESLNADKPYDRMVQEMLAADELAADDPETLRATGYLVRSWYKFNRNKWLDDAVEHTGKAFLATTFNCARCHDHMYDPVSHEEYYKLRAIFEPYDVRTDRVPGEANVDKDGLVRVFDAKLDAETFVFVRGNEKEPLKDNPLAPGVPQVLSSVPFAVEPVSLAPKAYYQGLKPFVREELEAAAKAAIEKAKSEVAAAEANLAAAKAKQAEFLTKQGAPESAPAAEAKPASEVVLTDDFTKENAAAWTRDVGTWEFRDGRLVQTDPRDELCGLISTAAHPRDFAATFKFKTTGGDTYKSVGIAFDAVGTTDFQAVYLSAHSPGPHLLTRQAGKDSYPTSAPKESAVEVGREVELKLAVRDKLANVWVDGKLVLAYNLPAERVKDGQLILWTYDATAEFLRVSLERIGADYQLAPAGSDMPSAAAADVLAAAVEDAERGIAIAQKSAQAAEAALASLLARIAADEANFSQPPRDDAKTLSLAAGAGERTHAALAAEAALLQAQLKAAQARRAVKPGDEKTAKAAADADKKVAESQAAHDAAQKALTEPTESYTRLADVHPATSTGRRLALARWITSPENPLPARVAINHLWLRHFGSPLVPTVFDFGLNGKPPTNQALLDWLAVELIENGWRMKPIHKLIVMSRTYRLASSSGGREQGTEHSALATSTSSLDPENQYYWRANPRRLEAEAVRDVTLAVAGSLDPARGGPELDQNAGLTVPRRSLYFRASKEKKMQFLSLFDSANPVECYRRSESIAPQQALAMANSTLTLAQARILAKKLSDSLGNVAAEETPQRFVTKAFVQILCREPTDAERATCLEFLKEQAAKLADPKSLTAFSAGPEASVPPATDPAQRARENLVHVLFNHNDFVTVR
ncbi:MAG: PSD1 and planctomycete cytochrome C domain-containing protein [Pirellulaceae bacterium]|nr:PSD1 and planctomycete cytochrome C domain-containing protein [Pirellulaceae bacterium]